MSEWLKLRENIRKDMLRPHQAADRVLRKFKIEAPEVPVENMLSDLQIHVLPVPSPGWVCALRSNGTGDSCIWVDSSLSTQQKRFAMAHELGHLLLHPTGYQYREGFKELEISNMEPTEREANVFARRLLMPPWMVTALVRSSNFDTTPKLAKLFNVSYETMNDCLNEILSSL